MVRLKRLNVARLHVSDNRSTRSCAAGNRSHSSLGASLAIGSMSSEQSRRRSQCVAAFEKHRNKHRAKADWQFTAADARIKPKCFSATF
jgi:hypothetical protein